MTRIEALPASGAAREAAIAEAVTVTNRDGRGRFVLFCDHASNLIPAAFSGLGLPAQLLEEHIAWDPGALPVAEHLSALLDAPLVAGGVSRLVLDVNRSEDSPTLIPEISEFGPIPGNSDLGPAERARRLEAVHVPFHETCSAVMEARQGQGCIGVAIHTITPVFRGESRPWQIGILFDRDRKLADHLISGLGREGGLTVGQNQPYGPWDGVYWTLDRHVQASGLPSVMIEIRNDEVRTQERQRAWAERLANLLLSFGQAGPQGRNVATG
jgi:predicted N-formylglutamate amidohydrolase